MKRESKKGDGTTTLFAYTAKERFGPWAGESWQSYVNWSGLTQLDEVLSDGILCPRLVGLDCDEDWSHNIQEDFQTDYFWDFAYLQTKLRARSDCNFLALARNPASDPKEWVAESGFQYVGLDLIEIGGGISAITNCGGFSDVFSTSEVSNLGLIPNWERAIAIQAKLAPAHPEDPTPNATSGPSGAGSFRTVDHRAPARHLPTMQYGVLFERIEEGGFPPGFYYAHIPSLGLTTHGLGVDGARSAAVDLLDVWLTERRANGESCPAPSEVLFSTLEVPDHALQSA